MMKLELGQDAEYDGYLEGYVGSDLAQKYSGQIFVPANEVLRELDILIESGINDEWLEKRIISLRTKIEGDKE